MKKAVLIHGWDGHPENAWFPWLKKDFERRGFEVIIPAMPNPEKPRIEPWVSKLDESVGKISGDILLIGHSIGCQTILRYLERVEKGKIKSTILVAPWMTLDEKTLEEEGPEVEAIAKPWMHKTIDFKKAKKHCKDFSILYSVNDPYANMGDLMMLKEELNARIFNCGKMWHFDDAHKIKKIPMLIDIIDDVEGEE